MTAKIDSCAALSFSSQSGRPPKELRELYCRGLSYPHVITSPCSCDYELKVKSMDDIPLVDLPCPCGKKGMYVVKWHK